MVSLLPGQLPGVLHPQPAEQRDPEHAEETLSGVRKHRGLQSHHLQRVSDPDSRASDHARARAREFEMLYSVFK